MSAAELLADFTRRGIQLRAEGERLFYDAPKGVMPPADLEQLRKHKSELLAYLNREAANTIAEPGGPCSAWQESACRTAFTRKGDVPDLTGQKVLNIVCPITGKKDPCPLLD
jgi:hypothetical protein